MTCVSLDYNIFGMFHRPGLDGAVLQTTVSPYILNIDSLAAPRLHVFKFYGGKSGKNAKTTKIVVKTCQKLIKEFVKTYAFSGYNLKS